MATVTGTVQLGKPWYLSKKVWIAVLALAAVLYSAITGKPETTDQVVALVTKVASIVGIVAPLILSIAHVDGKERDLALALISQAKTLGDPDPSPVPAQQVTVIGTLGKDDAANLSQQLGLASKP